MRSRRTRQLAAIMAVGCLTPVVAEVPHEMVKVAFEQHEIALGTAKRQTILTGFFLGGGMADVAVVSVDENGDRRLRIYEFRGGSWDPEIEATLRPEVLFVDTGSIGGRDRLITYENGRLNWFDPDSATERALVEVGASYRAADEGEIPHVDITRDLNRDGRDDVIMPSVDGFWISTQRSDGSFTDAIKLGPAEPFAQSPVGTLDVDEPASDARRTYGDVGITAATLPVYLSRVHRIDHDLDGRIDLVFWNGDHFDVYHQGENGQFDQMAETFTVDVPFDSDGVYSYLFEFSGDGPLSVIFGLRKKTERTVLHSFRDLNGDRVADLMTLTLAGRGVAKQRSVYEVHFGASTSDGIRFATDVSTTIHPGGRAGGMLPWGYASEWFEDLDGDGRVEIIYGYVRVGFGGMMRTLFGKSVPMNLELYRNREGSYPVRPTTARKLRRFAPFAGFGNIFFPPVLIGDVNGDGRADLLVGKSPAELHVFSGLTGPDLLARKPQKMAVSLPYDERKSWLSDLNGDGKQDLLVHHGPTAKAPGEPHRLTTLIAR